MNVGYSVPGFTTGKPIALGGSQGRSEATGRGCVFAIEEACKLHEKTLEAAQVAVQGFGNAGSVTALLLAERGAVNVSLGGAYSAAGLDLHAVIEHKRKSGSVAGCPGTDDLSNEELLVLDCDILVPAALEDQISAENAPSIKAWLIAEAANGQTSPEADDIPFDRGVIVLPDILANAGGVTVSYFEWVQAMQAFSWTENDVNERLHQIMRRSFHAVAQTSSHYGIHMRTAALVRAIERVADFTKLRGIYP